MAQIFPKWANEIPGRILLGLIIFATALVAGIWYYFSPEYTDVGYAPQQPINYSHKLHAGQLGLDCQYCHTSVDESKQANIPPTQTCMNFRKSGIAGTVEMPLNGSVFTTYPIMLILIMLHM